MCLNIDRSYHPKYGKKGQAFVAQQPILVYKCLTEVDVYITGGLSPYQGTLWEFRVEKRVRNFTYGWGARTRVFAGLHAFFTKDAERCRDAVVFPAVIPVGARFFIGERGEIVSTAMTVYRTEQDMLAAFGVDKIGPAIHRNTLTKRAR